MAVPCILQLGLASNLECFVCHSDRFDNFLLGGVFQSFSHSNGALLEEMIPFD